MDALFREKNISAPLSAQYDLLEIPSAERKNASQSKYVYRFVCGTILTAVSSGLFLLLWTRLIADYNTTGHLGGRANILMSLGLYTAVLFLMFRALGGYRIGVNRMTNILSAELVAIFMTNFINVLISMAVTGQFRLGFLLLREYSLLALAEGALLTLLTIPMVRCYKKLFPPLSVLEISGEVTNGLSTKVGSRPDKYRILRTIRYQENEEELRKEIEKYDAALINDLPDEEENRILKICFDLNKRVYFTPKLSDIIVRSSENLNLFDTPLYLCRNLGMSDLQRLNKRIFDIVFSSIALLAAFPLMLVTAIAIRLEDHGPVFFKQERVTLDGKRFMIYKFRSMIPEAEKDGRPNPARDHDERITRIGALIRRTRIDELPQFINILKGDMSVVGPRPERWEHVEKYTEAIPEFSYRLKVKGGLTGYAQVYGKYNTSALDKLKLDLEYIMNYSLILDLQIVLETVKILFQKEPTEGFRS
ncbi:MAG: sugar transferase [Lachnospiraceae bacterium]|nr:sugar transferase [Lachnospiraceae bacterium]